MPREVPMFLERVGLVAVSCLLSVSLSSAAEVVKFESASVPVSEFQQKRAQARGEVLQPARGDEIQAYVVKPSGDGPYPVIIYLHDCGGLASEVKSTNSALKAVRMKPHARHSGPSASCPGAMGSCWWMATALAALTRPAPTQRGAPLALPMPMGLGLCYKATLGRRAAHWHPGVPNG